MVKGTAVTRLEQAKHNLIDLVKNFKADMKFNIIAFDQGILAYEQRLVRAKPGARKDAVSWTSNLAPRGSTDIYGALITALDMEGVDTIFLLSDGAPSAGEVTDTEEILGLVSRRNRFLRCRINTIGIGLAGATKRFMERLASENFGESRTTD
jgi:hypothetical protein